MKAKICNGWELVRLGRYDVEYSADDDRVCLYVHTDDGLIVRVYIESDGSSHSESVTGTSYDDKPLADDDRQRAEVEIICE